MRITIGADHAGFELKHALITFLREQGHQLTDADSRMTKTLAIEQSYAGGATAGKKEP